jgi:hypothetical protein
MSERALATRTVAVSNAPTTIAQFGFAAADIAAATKAVISARDAGIMVTWSGETVSQGCGHFCGKNASCNVYSAVDVSRIQVIREGTTTASVTITLEIEE